MARRAGRCRDCKRCQASRTRAAGHGAARAGLVLLPGGWLKLIAFGLVGRRRRCPACGHPRAAHGR